jgi:tetratricopeptide (TPR) repeat protein
MRTNPNQSAAWNPNRVIGGAVPANRAGVRFLAGSARRHGSPCLAQITFLVLALTLATAAAAAPDTSNAVAFAAGLKLFENGTNAAPLPAGPPVNPALVQSAGDLASSNMALSAHNLKAPPTPQDYQRQLELARRERLEKNFEVAAQGFLVLLASAAPDEVKRTALLELALVAQGQNELPKAQRVYGEFLHRYPNDTSVPEVLLRQGLIYRQMGSSQLALSKFYGVMTATLRLKIEGFESYRRLVLQAQTEIADTYYLQGHFEEAVDFFQRLLKLETPVLNKPPIQFKLIRSLAQLDRKDQALLQAEDFLRQYSGHPEEPEVRFLLSTLLDQVGRTSDALRQVMILLQNQQLKAHQSPETWAYWQQRTGKELARKLYQEGDYVHALDIYLALIALNPAVAWQVPLQYEAGLVYERLQQPPKALACYDAILARERDLDPKTSPGLQEIIAMTKWRKNFLAWKTKAEKDNREVAKATQAEAPEKSAQ